MIWENFTQSIIILETGTTETRQNVDIMYRQLDPVTLTENIRKMILEIAMEDSDSVFIESSWIECGLNQATENSK